MLRWGVARKGWNCWVRGMKRAVWGGAGPGPEAYETPSGGGLSAGLGEGAEHTREAQGSQGGHGRAKLPAKEPQ